MLKTTSGERQQMPTTALHPVSPVQHVDKVSAIYGYLSVYSEG